MRYLLVVLASVTACVLIYCVLAFSSVNQLPYGLHGFPSSYPMNLEIRGTMEEDDLSLTHKVTYNAHTKEYVYYYRIEYSGKSPCLFSWDVLNMAMGKGEDVPFIMELVPGSSEEFTFNHSEPPLMYEGSTYLYKKQIDRNYWQRVPQVSQLGPLPHSFVLEDE